MKIMHLIILLSMLILNIQAVAAAENEYGIVRAWFKGENATVNGAQIQIGEPFEVKVEILSKIDGNVYVELYEPGITKSYALIEGNSGLGESIDNHNIITGWSKTYLWTLKPNGAWKNGNAPINIRVSFSKKGNQKPIEFTIANPYILDEQYSGAVPTPETTASPAGTPVKEAPFLPAILTVGALLLAWRRGREKT
jgi:sarcinarray family protein